MNLPSALAPWSRYLNIFPAEISVALGPIVQRLALVLGAARSQFKEKEGDPDGFDGLNRRGTYERLLLSEWMLADEIPDEFMRRAVMGEHLFLNPARSSPVGTRASLALFDSGPSQLGTPRIAHLAALIVLANRADSAGAMFGWGVLQQTDAPVLHEVNASTVMRLIEARSHAEATASEFAAWESKVATWDQLDDVWLIGGQRLSRLQTNRRTSRLYVQDKLEPGARQLSVAVSGASNGATEVILDLPNDKVSTRLLRDPFEAAVAEQRKVSHSQLAGANLLFDNSGTKLFTRSKRWEVTAFNVPNSPRAGAGKPKKYRTRRWDTVAAVGKLGRGIALISAEDHFVRLEYCRQGQTKLAAGNYTGYNNKIFYTPPGDDDTGLRPCFMLPWDKEMAVLDAAGSLFRLVSLKGDEKVISGKHVVGMAHLVATDVLAVAMVNSRLVYVGKEWPGNNAYIVSLGTDIERMAIPFEGNATRAFFGPPSGINHPKFGLLAIQQNEFQWTVISIHGETMLVRPRGAKVVGVMGNSRRGLSEPGLLALEDNKRTITLNGRNWRREVLEASAPIDRVAVDHVRPLIAYSTIYNELVIWSVTHEANLCRFVGDEVA